MIPSGQKYRQYTQHQENYNTIYHNRTANTEKNIIKQIQEKQAQCNAINTKADKGNTIIITTQNDYCNKIKDWIASNKFSQINFDPTNIFQKTIRKSLNNCNTLIPKELKWKYLNLNPTASSLQGFIKIHKPEDPVRPVVNWHNAQLTK